MLGRSRSDRTEDDCSCFVMSMLNDYDDSDSDADSSLILGATSVQFVCARL